MSVSNEFEFFSPDLEFVDTRGMRNNTDTFQNALEYNHTLAKTRKAHGRYAYQKKLFESARLELIRARANLLRHSLTAAQRKQVEGAR